MRRAFIALTVGVACLAAGTAGYGSHQRSDAPTLEVSFGAALTSASADLSMGAPYVISGCGYGAAGVSIVVQSPISTQFTGQVPDASGCISISNFSTLGSGHYTVSAYERVRKQDRLVASTGFDV